jgi:uncharacterized membrane protein
VEVGSVEYIIIEFPSSHFQAEIVPELAKLIESGTVRIFDLVFVLKDTDGKITTYEFDQLEELAPYAALSGEVGGFINSEDVDYAADALEPGSSAVLIVWEDTWANGLYEAVRRARGVMLEGARIPAQLVDAALADLGADVDAKS